jgi:plastocyanin
MIIMSKIPAALAALATTAVCGAAALPALAASGAPKTATVTLKDISFKKSTVGIAKGGTVTWVWKDGDTPHNVTFAHKHSGTKKSGTYKMTFARTGTFKYHCTIHPGMDGKIVVK